MIGRLDRETEEQIRPSAKAVESIGGIPGIGRRIAEGVLAETRTDMAQFPSAAHLASWRAMSIVDQERDSVGSASCHLGAGASA